MKYYKFTIINNLIIPAFMSLIFHVVWPIISSGSLLGLISFFFKKKIERKIDHRFKEIELAHKLQLEEISRRESKLFDEQFASYKLLAATTYRLKNSAKSLCYLIDQNEHIKAVKDEFEIFRNCSGILTETLYADKLIIEDDVFSLVHDLKHATASFSGLVDVFLHKKSAFNKISLDKLRVKIDSAHFQALSLYKTKIDSPATALIGRI